MHATHIKMADSPAEVIAMDSIRNAILAIPFTKKAFAYTRFYIGWETNKVTIMQVNCSFCNAKGYMYLTNQSINQSGRRGLLGLV